MNELLAKSDIADIIEKVEREERLSFEDGVRLFESNDITAIGWAADLVRRRMNGSRTYYVVNRHINHTDVCKNRCKFCAYSRSEGEDGAYTMTVPQIVARAEELYRDLKFTELHLVGGLHPTMPFSYYTDMLSSLKSRLPDVHLQAFTAVEIAHIAEIGGMSVEECLIRLRDAGLGSMPGGGAEVFEPAVRDEICPEKMSGDEWLRVMRAAHNLGIKSNATMLYGHVESAEDRVNHLLRLRELQDETGGFMSYIPLRFHAENTRLAHLARPRSGMDDLKAIAVGRLMLDNFPHVKVFWIMFGLKLAQVALSFGADDFDGTVVEEKITHRAGAQTPEGITVAEIRRLIEETGTVPIERDTLYKERTGDGSWVMGHGSWAVRGKIPRTTNERKAALTRRTPKSEIRNPKSEIALGCLPYLNVKPLVYPFEHGMLPDGWDLVYATPSTLAEMLADRRIDAAPVSSFACLADRDLYIAPRMCISSNGPVKTVLMLSKMPPADVKSVAVDTSSLSGRALLRVVLSENYGAAPVFESCPPDLDAMLSEHDGALLIGNLAMLCDKTRLHVCDLGEEWKKLTGLPAVFAVWAGPRESFTPQLIRSLLVARADGIVHLGEIAVEESVRLKVPAEVCMDYLTNVMCYELGDPEIESLRIFGRKALEHGLLDIAPEVRLAGC